MVGRVLITHPRAGGVVRAKADFEKVAVGLQLERRECDCGAGGAEGSFCRAALPRERRRGSGSARNRIVQPVTFPPPSRGSFRRPPSSHATGLGPAHRARGARSGGGARVVLVRVRQHFHSLRSVGLGVFPLKSRRRLGEVQRSSPPLHPVAYSLSDIRSAKKVSVDPPPRVGGGCSSLPFPPS